MGKRKATPEQRLQAIAMLEEGKTGAEVAKKFGVSRVRVYQWKVEARKQPLQESSDNPAYARLLSDVEQLKVDMQLVKRLLAKRK